MSGDTHRPTAVIRPAVIEDIEAIVALWCAHGEGNVDVRPIPEIVEAIEGHRLFVLVDVARDMLVGTGGIYEYSAEGKLYLELGSSVLHPNFRSRGFAQISVAFRALYSMLMNPGARCVSELYFGSQKSKFVLAKAGFEEIVPTNGMAQHAAAVSDVPVVHMALTEEAIPGLAKVLLEVVKGGDVVGHKGDGHIIFDAACVYQFSFLKVLEMMIDGDLSPVSLAEPALESSLEAQPKLIKGKFKAVFAIIRQIWP